MTIANSKAGLISPAFFIYKIEITKGLRNEAAVY